VRSIFGNIAMHILTAFSLLQKEFAGTVYVRQPKLQYRINLMKSEIFVTPEVIKNVKFPMWYAYSLTIKHLTALKKYWVC
jgi:hypothetical protein